MDKQIDFKKTIYELCKEYPWVVDIMKQLGFESIVNPVMIASVGRIMTIPKGAVIKGIELQKIKDSFQISGFTVTE